MSDSRANPMVDAKVTGLTGGWSSTDRRGAGAADPLIVRFA
ncbi:hypothetical protein ACWCRD_42005 [Streptomyces sp. NPDC002092]